MSWKDEIKYRVSELEESNSRLKDDMYGENLDEGHYRMPSEFRPYLNSMPYRIKELEKQLADTKAILAEVVDYVYGKKGKK